MQLSAKATRIVHPLFISFRCGLRLSTLPPFQNVFHGRCGRQTGKSCNCSMPFFAERRIAQCCWRKSAFDEPFVQGISEFLCILPAFFFQCIQHKRERLLRVQSQSPLLSVLPKITTAFADSVRRERRFNERLPVIPSSRKQMADGTAGQEFASKKGN